MFNSVKVKDNESGNVIPSWHICELGTINKILSITGFRLAVKLDDDGPTCFLVSWIGW